MTTTAKKKQTCFWKFREHIFKRIEFVDQKIKCYTNVDGASSYAGLITIHFIFIVKNA